MLGITGRSLLPKPSSSINAIRGIANIPVHERHIRFDPKEGRKRPAQDVLDRLVNIFQSFS